MPTEPVSACHAAPDGRIWSSQDSGTRERLRRRVVTIPGVLLGFVLFAILALPALLIGGLVDVVLRRKWPTIRLVLYAVWWAALESAGVLIGAALWLRYAPGGRLEGSASFRAHSRLQRWWASNLVRGARFLLGLEHDFDDAAGLGKNGPLVVLARHGSQGDALLVAALLAESGLRPRFILKKQLLWDPCLDVVGHRIPNYFVDRDTADNHEEVANLGRLAAGMESDEVLVIFPEGTRFSKAKLGRAVDVVSRASPDRSASVQRLQHVLPIRTAGVLAVLQNSPTSDLLFLNHVGVSDFRGLGDLWRNVPFPSPLRFRADLVPRQDAPACDAPEELVQWLDKRWELFDSWVGMNSPSRPGETLPV